MKKKVKKILKNIFNKYGYSIIKQENYNQLVKRSLTKELPSSDKNDLLHSFFTLLKKQNFYPETIYDIGANKGNWTKECLQYFSDATYYLFEPQQNLKKDIIEVMGDNKKYKLFSLGVGNVNGILNFTIHDRDDSCTFSYTKEEAKEQGLRQEEIPIVRLEDFIKEKQLKRPNILKIDAEGLDLQVLRGAESLLKDCEVIMVEVAIVNKRIDNTALKMLSFMDEYGYKIFDITDLNRPFSNKILWLSEFVFIKKGCVLDKNYTVS